MRKVKIGLALGSGAARGWSHIGVINALQRLGIEIDIVAGCSIGSLVGAAYSCGKLPELETWVRSFSYWDVLRLMDLSWQRGGLLRGERVFNQYRQVMPLTEFTDCQRPFGAVATNLSTGLKLSASTSLGPRERVVIVEVEDARLVLGVTASNINVLHKLPPAPVSTEDSAEVPADFQSVMKSLLKRSGRS
jgi:predicted acylesterase/phospholipase RssA